MVLLFVTIIAEFLESYTLNNHIVVRFSDIQFIFHALSPCDIAGKRFFHFDRNGR
jgi:hypothetical protein